MKDHHHHHLGGVMPSLTHPAGPPSLGGDSRPSSRPSSKPDATRGKPESKDDVMIVGSKEGTPRLQSSHLPQHLTPPTSHLPPHTSPFMSHATPHHSLSPHSLSSHFPTSSTSPIDRARLMQGVYGPGSHPGSVPPGHHLGSWPDPFRDPYRAAAAAAAAIHDPLSAARAHDLAARESMLGRDHLREQLNFDRAREEHFLRASSLGGANPLSPLIWNERYREHQARELIDRERERQMAGAAAAAGLPPGLYPSSSLYGPPVSTHMSSLLPPSFKTASPMNPSHPMHPGLNPQGIGSLHPGASHPSLGGAPGLPPPLISSLRGPSPALPRPPDKKDPPR